MWNLLLESVASALRPRLFSIKIRTGHVITAVRADPLAASRPKPRRAARTVIHRQRRLLARGVSCFAALRWQIRRFFWWFESEVWPGHLRVLGSTFIAHPAH